MVLKYNMLEYPNEVMDGIGKKIQGRQFERLLVKYTPQGIPVRESIQYFYDRNKVS